MSEVNMADKKSPLTYTSSGVDYEIMDPFKRMAQKASLETAEKLFPLKAREITDVLGDSAFIFQHGELYMVFVIEGLGSKNLVADKMYELTGKSYYDSIAKDTVAAIVNDLITVGAKPLVVNAYFGLGSSNWLKDEKRAKDLIEGWKNACLEAEALYGGGETPTLTGIINENTIDLAGSCVGIVEGRLPIVGNSLMAGDNLLLIESNGIHANGLTLARKVAENLDDGYLSEIEDGGKFGEELLKPSHIYSKMVQELILEGVEIHYMVNITGHGFRKLMRSKKQFKYVVDQLPEVPAIFKFIQKEGGLSDEEMYATFNMGAGFAIYLPDSSVAKAQDIARKHGFKSWKAGKVEEGEKQVEIKSLDIIYKAESLGVR